MCPIGSGSDEDMRKYNWLKEFTWRDIGIEPDKDEKVTSTYYDFFASDMPCPTCRSEQFVWIIPEIAGVYWACALCKIVNGPIAMSFGVERKKEEISVDEAIAILKARGVKRMPIAFGTNERAVRIAKRRRAKLRRRKPKKVA